MEKNIEYLFYLLQMLINVFPKVNLDKSNILEY